MRLVVELTGLQSGSRLRGIGRYTQGLIEGLVHTAGEHEVWLAGAENHALSLDAVRTQFRGLIPPERIVGYRVLDQVQYGKAEFHWKRMASEAVRDHFLGSLPVDAILYSSLFEGFGEDVVSSVGDLSRHVVRAGIAYDLIPLMSPEKYLNVTEVKEWYYAKLDAFCSCDILLAISQSARREVTKFLDIGDSRIADILSGTEGIVGGSQLTPQAESVLRARLGLSLPFFVYTASIEPRKNFERLITAFGHFVREMGPMHQLVLVTSDADWVRSAFMTVAAEAGLGAGQVIITGQIDDAELRYLYKHCTALVYPSLHEGFGLPAVEAMHFDAPVIGSNTSSLPEVIGLEEALFDPLSVEGIADKMIAVVRDDAFRARLKQNAVVRRALFTWDKTGAAAWRAVEAACRARYPDGPPKASRSERYRALLAALKDISPKGADCSEDDRRALADAIAGNLDTLNAVAHADLGGGKPGWRVEGPFDSSYSLALVNRETARALEAKGETVVLHSTEGPGDYSPNEAFLAAGHPDILALWRAGEALEPGRPVVVARNLYPPRVEDAAGAYNILHQYAWEEGSFPAPWVDQFNLHLDGIACVSSHVKKVLQDSGVVVPMVVSGNGVDHWERIEAGAGKSFPGKSFRFLHVSSCFPRKGADVLLEAYGQAFRRQDDVTLLIKTFENLHNDIAARLEAARAADPDFPDVALLFGDLAEAELKALYQHSHVLVAPSRAEGYGLPLAEAMLSGVPVITTNWSGQLDFCNDETAWLVDYDFAPARTHFQLAGSVWAEPDPVQLAQKMREAWSAPSAERARKAAAGRKLLMRDHTWSAVVDRMSFLVDGIRAGSGRRAKPHVGWITTWNCECGIATYSDHLVRQFPEQTTIFAPTNERLIANDDSRVVRCWRKDVLDDDLEGLSAALDDAGIDVVVVQFNYGFFEFGALGRFILEQKKKSRTVVVELHSVIDKPDDIHGRRLVHLKDALAECDRILVHSYRDLNRLKDIGIVGNAALFPHGIVEGLPSDFLSASSGRKFTIGSYGFCLPHKGLKNLVSAFGLLAPQHPHLHLHMVNAEYPADVSRDLALELRVQMAGFGLGGRVRFTNDFLPDDEALAHLRACDLIVFAYGGTAESASGAVRFGIASGRPVLTTDIPIFEELRPIVFQVESAEPDKLAEGLADVIARLRAGGQDVKDKEAAAARWRHQHDYGVLSARLAGMIEALHMEAGTRV